LELAARGREAVRGGKNAIELQLETLKLERDVALQQQEEATAELERILELLQTIEADFTEYQERSETKAQAMVRCNRELEAKAHTLGALLEGRERAHAEMLGQLNKASRERASMYQRVSELEMQLGAERGEKDAALAGAIQMRQSWEGKVATRENTVDALREAGAKARSRIAELEGALERLEAQLNDALQRASSQLAQLWQSEGVAGLEEVGEMSVQGLNKMGNGRSARMWDEPALSPTFPTALPCSSHILVSPAVKSWQVDGAIAPVQATKPWLA